MMFNTMYNTTEDTELYANNKLKTKCFLIKNKLFQKRRNQLVYLNSKQYSISRVKIIPGA